MIKYNKACQLGMRNCCIILDGMWSIVMKKGYYIHFQGRTSIGVAKKIDMQM